jgi:hypothetical protein
VCDRLLMNDDWLWTCRVSDRLLMMMMNDIVSETLNCIGRLLLVENVKYVENAECVVSRLHVICHSFAICRILRQDLRKITANLS